MAKLKAGDKCVQCTTSDKGTLRYEGKDKSGPHNSYQRILKCSKCSWEVLEDEVKTR